MDNSTKRRLFETADEWRIRRTKELNEIITYECECGKTFKWRLKNWRILKYQHHKTQTHIKKVENRKNNAGSVLPNPLLNIKMPPSRE